MSTEQEAGAGGRRQEAGSNIFADLAEYAEGLKRRYARDVYSSEPQAFGSLAGSD